MKILFQNQYYVVAVKDPGVLSEHGPGGMPELLADRLQVSSERIFTVHRLDKPTGGVMVYALDARTAGRLSQEIAERHFHKGYLAVCEDAPAASSDTWTDFLYWDRLKQKAYVVDRMRKGVKTAELSYRILARNPIGHTLFSVELATGRTHQIRVQFSSRGFPLLGDRRYGSHTDGDLGLWASSLSFSDPYSGKKMLFVSLPPDVFPWHDPSFSNALLQTRLLSPES